MPQTPAIAGRGWCEWSPGLQDDRRPLVPKGYDWPSQRFGDAAALVSANHSTFDHKTGVLILRDGGHEFARYDHDAASDRLRFVVPE